MEYDFDRIIDRRGTDCNKWQFHEVDGTLVEWPEDEGCFGEEGVLPLWVADMDLPSPQPVVDALVNRARHGIYGYTGRSRAYNECVALWMRKRHGWEIRPEWIQTTPGVVNALYAVVQAFTEPGDGVLIQPPVYHPFRHAVEKNDRTIVPNPLLLQANRYEMDFADLEKKVRDPKVKVAFLCHPHNPVGRVWTPEELRHFGETCNANDVVVVSDEVHGDLIYSGVRFVSYPTLGPEFEDNVILCSSPSKTFNLPGLKTSNILIPNPEIRKIFAGQLERNGLYGLNAFGSTALQAAYRFGDEWLDQVMAYIEGNYRYLCEVLAQNLPAARVIPPEGTYLVWLDLRALDEDFKALHERLLKEAKIYLDDGGMFGPQGLGFTRMNIACPRPLLAEALERFTNALK